MTDAAAIDPAFADLAGQADQLEKETAAPVAVPGAAAPAAPVDYNAEARDLVEFLHSLFVPLYPSLGQVYTPEVRGRIAATAGPLMQKYHFTMGAFGPELMFGLVVVPLIVPTAQAIKHDREQLRKAAEAKAAEKGEGAASGAGPAAVGADAGEPVPLHLKT